MSAKKEAVAPDAPKKRRQKLPPEEAAATVTPKKPRAPRKAAAPPAPPIPLVLIVNGDDVRVEADSSWTLAEVRAEALKQIRNTARPAAEWELYDIDGKTLHDPSKPLSAFDLAPETRLFLSLKVGAGGVEPAAPVPVNATAVLAKHLGLDEGPEIIDGCDVAKIAADETMLEVACSPVLFFRRDPNRSPMGDDGSAALRPCIIACEAYELEGGEYRVALPERHFRFSSFARHGFADVSAADLRVMRARWLLRRGEILRTWNDLDRETKLRLIEVFFRGEAPYVPPAGSPLDALVQGTLQGPISIPRDGDGPVDIRAIFQALSTPGAAIPAVCPAPLEGPVLPPPPALEPPPDAILEGEHSAACGYGRVNEPSLLDVGKLPKNFRLCVEHWARVKAAQGGVFRRPAPTREYVDDDYLDSADGGTW